MADNAQELDELLTLPEVLRAEGCSRSTLYARIERGEFPRPIANPSGRGRNLWRKSHVVQRQQARFAQLDAVAKKQREQAAA